MKKLHILFLRFSSLGDIILNSSLAPAVKSEHGDKVFLTYMTSAPFNSLLEGHPALDQVIGVKRERGKRGRISLVEAVKEIHRKRPIDLIVDQHGTLRSLYLRFKFPEIPRIYVDKRTVERSILTMLKIDFLSGQFKGKDKREDGHGELLLKRNIRDFAPVFSLKKNCEQLTSWIDQHGGKTAAGQLSSCRLTFEKEDSSKIYPFQSSPYAVIVPSASFIEKRWPKQNFYQLCENLINDESLSELKYVITAGAEDTFCDIFNELEQKYPNKIFNLQGKTSLKETVGLVREAIFCLGNDTGIPHFAESVGVPSLFILGPTGEEFGFYPHLKASRVISQNIWCRPCTTNGKGNCIRSQRFCLTDISVKKVHDEVLSLVSRIGGFS